MNKFEKALIDKLGKERMKKIQKQKIGIAGAGGLGSNCALNLVRSGFKKFIICDYDIIEYSNLNRQFYYYFQIGQKKAKTLQRNLQKINTALEIEVVDKKLIEKNINKIFSGCDILVEALDNIEGKKMMAENYISDNRLFVTASGLAGWGDSDEICVKKINKNSYMIGDCKTGVSKENPPISPRVNIAAAKQADIILNYVLEEL